MDGLVVERAVGLYVGDVCVVARCDLGQGANLLVNRVGDFFGRQIQLDAAKVGAIGVTGIRSEGEFVAKSLLDGGGHRLRIAGVAAAGDVDGSDGAHQDFLRAVGDVLGQLAHVAIEVDVVHWFSEGDRLFEFLPVYSTIKKIKPAPPPHNARAQTSLET